MFAEGKTMARCQVAGKSMKVSVTAMCRFDVRYCKYLFLILAADYLLTLIYFISLYLRGNFLLKTKDVNYVDPLHWMERDAMEPHHRTQEFEKLSDVKYVKALSSVGLVLL